MTIMPPSVEYAVQRLMGDYTYAVDDLGDPERVVELFTPEAVIDFTSVAFPLMEGQDTIREFYTGLFATMHSQFHFLANFRPAGWDGDVAIGEAYVIGMGHPRDGDDILVHVRYRMECVETNGRWLIRRFNLKPMMP